VHDEIDQLDPAERQEHAAQAVHQQVAAEECRGTDRPVLDAAEGERGPLDDLNVMNLGTPYSAIISAIVFNALIIPALVPLALRGVKYRAIGATALLRRNLILYGLGGVILPFVGIKLIDLVVHNLFGA
jgi:K+-transporting ATPase ATPase B chain